MKNKQQALHYTSYVPHSSGRLIILISVVFLEALGFFLTTPSLLHLFINFQQILVPIKTSLAMRDFLYEVTLTLALIGFIVGAPLLGLFSDHFGRKKLILTCLLGALLGYLLPVIGVVSNTILLVFLGRFVAGAAMSSVSIIQAAISDLTEGKRKASYYATVVFAVIAALIIGPYAGAYLIDSTIVKWFNFTTTFFVGISLTVINLCLIWFFYQDETQLVAKSTAPKWKIPKKLMGLFVVFFLTVIGWSKYYQAIFIYLTQRFHYSVNQISVFTLYIGFWLALGLLVIYRLMLRFLSVEHCLLIASLITAVSFIGCSFTHAANMQWIFVAPAATFTGIVHASLLSIISDRTSAHHQAWVLGVANMTLGLAWLLTDITTHYFMNYYLPLPLLVAATAMVIAMLLTWITQWKVYREF